MNLHFIIDTENGGRFYAFFYFIAFLAGSIILILEGRKRKFPTVSWLLIIMTCFLFFIVGTQVVRLSAGDWASIFRFKELDHSVGRSALGGILFAIPGLLLAKYILKLPTSTIDAFALALPIGMMIQRFGCLLAGCCFGAPTSLPWGIQYGAASHPFNQHLQDSLIRVTSNASLPIHPIAIYEILGCALGLFALMRLRKYIVAPGNLFLSSIGLYAVVRFTTEFFRLNSSTDFTSIGITKVQFILLIVLFFLVNLIVIRERTFQPNSQKSQIASGNYAIAYFFFLSALFLGVSRWLTRLEIISLNFIIVPIILFVVWNIFKTITVPSLRLTTGCLLIGSLLMMSQTFPEKQKKDSTQYSYHVLSVGTMTSSNNFEYEVSDCNGGGTSYNLNNSSNISGAGYAFEKHNGSNTSTLGINAYSGYQKEIVQSSNPMENQENRFSIFGIQPYLQFDRKLVGFGMGVHMGSLALIRQPESSTSVRNIAAFPSGYFRIGYLRRTFGEIKLCQQFPSPFPMLSFQTNIGFGLGNKGGAIRFGTATYAGIYCAPTIVLGDQVVVEPYLGGLPSIFFREGLAPKENFVGAISLRYRFRGRSSK